MKVGEKPYAVEPQRAVATLSKSCPEVPSEPLPLWTTTPLVQLRYQSPREGAPRSGGWQPGGRVLAQMLAVYTSVRQRFRFYDRATGHTAVVCMAAKLVASTRRAISS